MTATEPFRAARDFLLTHRDDPQAAYAGFRWPGADALQLGARLVRRGRRRPSDRSRPALWLVEPDGGETRCTFAELADRSTQVAAWLREQRRARAATGCC